MPALKNHRRERFAQGLAKGLTAVDAYARAGYKRDDGAASRMIRKPDVVARLAEIQERAATRVEIDKAWIMDKLRHNAETCLHGGQDERNPTAANRALELLGKELGMFKDKIDLGIGDGLAELLAAIDGRTRGIPTADGR